MSSVSLRDQINQQFNDDELRQLCFDLIIEYENLHGDTRITKAQSLVEHCLRHDRLPELDKRCKELRPTVNWVDSEELAAEWQDIQQVIAAQKGLKAILPADQLTATLELLRKKETELLIQLTGSGAIAQGDNATAVGERGVNAHDVNAPLVTGDNNHIGNIVTVYREGGDGSIPDKQLRKAIAAYVRWVDRSYGRIRLRGLSEKEYLIPDPDLPDIYVSLIAQGEAGGAWKRQGIGKEQKPIDMSNLLGQGNRLVITGAPGSGKTTFLRHIAHLLAHALYSGDDTAITKQLNININDESPLPLPIYLSLGDYYHYKKEHQSSTLISFISYTLLRQHSVYNLPDDFFAQLLSRENTVCLLLDSLDEIPDENGRSRVVNDVINLADNDIGQIIVASRDHAYVGRSMLSSDFHRFIVQPMRPEQVAALTKRWCMAVYPPQEAADETRKLQDEIAALEAIRKAQGEEPLIDTPLMVTIVAIVHWNNQVLPQQRAALYEKCVTALLAEQHKEDEGQGQSRLELEKQSGGSLDAKRGQLAQLAYEMMSSRTDKDAGRAATQEQIETWLLPLFKQIAGEEAATELETFRVAMCDRASILHEYGGRYEFTHLTFQEFLCAFHLASNLSPTGIAYFFEKEDRVLQSWWRETILLTIGYLGKTAVIKALNLTQKMVSVFPAGGTELAAAELAAAGLLELEAPAPDARQQVHDRLVALLTDPAPSVPLDVRALAGRTLSRLGDRRRGVGTTEKNGITIPDILWGGEVPAGVYAYQDATYEIKRPYRLAQYLVTYSQFQCFIDADDFADSRWWAGMPPEGKSDLDTVYQLQELSEQSFRFATHPRESVSWYQAVAFCHWLSDKADAEIALPTEQEWEIAARWDGEKVDNRAYPWGDKFDVNKANTNEGDVNQTTAVGIYPSGKNEALSLYDMSGNLSEWCGNKYNSPDDIDVDGSNAGRVLRDGSWNFNLYAARAANRRNYFPADRDIQFGFRVVCVRPPSHLDH